MNKEHLDKHFKNVPLKLIIQEYKKEAYDDYGVRSPNMDSKENAIGLGVAFPYKGKFCRVAIKVKEGYTLEDLGKLWTLLAKAIAAPDDPKVCKDSVLVGEEICI